jgi:hypothetical protein
MKNLLILAFLFFVKPRLRANAGDGFSRNAQNLCKPLDGRARNMHARQRRDCYSAIDGLGYSFFLRPGVPGR